MTAAHVRGHVARGRRRAGCLRTAYEKVLLAVGGGFDLDTIYLRPEIRQDLDDLRR